MKENCLFCKIIRGEIDSKIIFENQSVLAFNDINPQAPIHILIIPKVHISTLNDIQSSQIELVGEMVKVSTLIAKDLKIAKNGYRTIFNCNQDAGQTVFHIHLHLLGGRTLNWPPG
ncbi:MAG: histidine triad nucleotide-binding protein [Fidelibacterota bacterium]|jgi:histidine triad (HIT) family protein|tara:strand:- start:917 stop:1264 length:348 start_codon:yes stop_codon:yes gene_type:complete